MKRATGICIDTENCFRIYCSEDTTAEDLYHAILMPLKVLYTRTTGVHSEYELSQRQRRRMRSTLNQDTSQTDSRTEEESQSHTSTSYFSYSPFNHSRQYSTTDPARQNRDGFGSRPYLGSVSSPKSGRGLQATENEQPYVCILQNIEKLPRRLQICLLEVMTTRRVPMKLVSVVAGTDPILAHGATKLPDSYFFMGISTNRPFNDIDYDALTSDANPAGSLREPEGEAKYLGILPFLYDEFSLRISLLLPHQKILYQLLSEKISSTGTTEYYMATDSKESTEATDTKTDTQNELESMSNDLAESAQQASEVTMSPRILQGIRSNSFTSNPLGYNNFVGYGRRSMTAEQENRDFYIGWIRRSLYSVLWPSSRKASESEDTTRLEIGSGRSGFSLHRSNEFEVIEDILKQNPEIIRVTQEDFQSMRHKQRAVHANDEVKTYIRDILSDITMHPQVVSGPCPETFKSVLAVVKADAVLERSKFCTTMNVHQVILDCLPHRLSMKAEKEADKEQENFENLILQPEIHPYGRAVLCVIEVMNEQKKSL